MPGVASCGRRSPRILTGFLVASALLGVFFAPSNAGKSLAEIQEEREVEPTGRFTRDSAPAEADSALSG